MYFLLSKNLLIKAMEIETRRKSLLFAYTGTTLVASNMTFIWFGVLTVVLAVSKILDKACDPNLFARMVAKTKQLQYNVPVTNNRSDRFSLFIFATTITLHVYYSSLEDVARGQSDRAMRISCFAQDMGTFYHGRFEHACIF